ncbi:TPA: cellulase family glycosylhydrolase [Klebsiella pneumoniae]|uniref:cellulase family glycosylhydrolase n=1 Tax=Klebsiella pneumoniae TaxID=573 RepID=UPI002FEEDFB8
MKFIHFISFFVLFSCSAFSSDKVFYYGVGGHPNNYAGQPVGYVNLVKSFNFNSVRFDYYWSNVERKPGVYTSPTSKDIQVLIQAAKADIKPLIVLGYDNPLYFKGKPVTNSDLEHFANYAAYVAMHFSSQDPIIEIWNEWSIDHQNLKSSRSAESAQKYVDLVKLVSEKVRKVNPKTIIIVGSFNPLIKDDLSWGKKIISLGVLNYIDGLSIHTYKFGPPNIPDVSYNMAAIDSLHSFILQKYNINADMYITEVGLPTDSWTRYDPVSVAKYAKKYFSSASEIPYIRGVWWYDLMNGGDNFHNGEYNFGILDSKGIDKGGAQYFMKK